MVPNESKEGNHDSYSLKWLKSFKLNTKVKASHQGSNNLKANSNRFQSNTCYLNTYKMFSKVLIFQNSVINI